MVCPASGSEAKQVGSRRAGSVHHVPSLPTWERTGEQPADQAGALHGDGADLQGAVATDGCKAVGRCCGRREANTCSAAQRIAASPAASPPSIKSRHPVSHAIMDQLAHPDRLEKKMRRRGPANQPAICRATTRTNRKRYLIHGVA
jgi:hypothetical protein